jgi:PAS domain-containing protein
VSRRSILSRIHPEDQEAMVRLRATLESGAPFAMDCRILLPDASIRWVHARGAVTERRGEVARMGCDLAQGYYLARPMDAVAFDAVLGGTLSPIPARR